MKTKFFILVSILFLHAAVKAQMKIGDNSTNINNASLLELESTNKGLVLPRVPLSSVTSSSPLPAGLLTGTVVYNTSNSATGGSGAGIYVWDGAKWIFLSTSNSIISSAWTVNGNTGTTAANFLGTTDNISMRFRTNNLQRMIIDSTGKIGIGLNNPGYALSVLAASNPLYLSGVQATTTFSTDSILTINSGVVKKTPYSSLASSGNWSLTGNSGTTAGTNYIGTTDNIDFVTKTNGTERMRVLANGRVGIGITDPNYPLAVKDTMEIRRVGSLSELLFSNTAGTGDFRIAGDGGDLFWQGGGGRGLQMGSYWTTILGGDRQTTAFPAFINAPANTGVLVLGQRDGSVPLGIQANSLTQSANLTEWRNASLTVLSAVNKSGYLGIGTSSPTYPLSVLAASNPLYLSGVQATSTLSTDSILTIAAGVVKKAPYSVISGSTTNSLTLNTNTITSVVNGVSASTSTVSRVSNTSTANTLNTTVNGVAGTTVPIINSNANTLTQSGGLVTTVNGVAATTAISSGTVSNILGYNTSGNAVYQPINNINLSTAWNVLGNTGTTSENFLGTIDNISMRFRTNNIQRMIIDSLGRVGIGLTNPTNALSVIASSDPLYLSGVQATSTLNSDSLLTINGGIVKKSPYSSLNNNYWSLTGNTGTNSTTNFLGTTDNVGLSFRTNNTQKVFIDSIGSVGIGSSAFDPVDREKLLVDYGNTSSSTLATYRGSINDFLQINLQNKSNGSSASSDYVATADDGTDSTNYVDFGINSSTYAPSIENWGAAHDAYLYSNSRNLLIGTQSTNSDLIFMVNGGKIAKNTALRIANPSGNVIIGSGDGTITPIGNMVRGPKAGGTNITGGNLTLQGGSSTGSASSNLNLYGGLSASGTYGAVNIIANPLTVTGVQQTTSFTTDSVLTINGTVIKKAPFSSLAGSGNWSLTGNAGTSYATNFLGTTDNVSFRLRTNNVQRVIIDSLGKVGIGTSTPSSDLTIYQSSGSGSAKGFTFTGNSISGNNSGTGFLISLGFNTAGNKQLWLGDADYAGVAAGSFARFVTTGTVFPVIDAVSGDNASRRYLAFGVAGDPNSGVIFGGDNTGVNPGSQVWDNGNMSIGAGYKSAAAPANGLLVQGNVGIGTTSPPSALSIIAASNPMYISGLSQVTSLVSNDSVLIISGGVVKKAQYALISAGVSVGAGWSLNGNTLLTPGSYLGTTALSLSPQLVFKYAGTTAGTLDANNTSYGTGSTASGNTNNTAIGYSATAANSSTAVGANSSAPNVASTAIGNSALANSSDHETAIGASSVATAQYNTALGYNAQAKTGAYATAIGTNSLSTGYQSIALGTGTNSSADQTVSLGYNAQASGQFGIAIGNASSAQASNSIAIGSNASINQINSMLLGSVSNPNFYVGIGTAAPAAKLHIVGNAGGGYNPLQISGLPTGVSGTDNILTINSTGIVGYVTPATFNSNYWSLNGNAPTTNTSFLGTTNGFALQFKSQGLGAGVLDGTNTSYGISSVANAGTNNTAIGNAANAANGSTAVGVSSTASAANDVAIGNGAVANGSTLETAIGAGANVNSQEGTAVGNAAVVQAGQGTALGASSKATAQYGVAVGYKSTSGSGQAIAVGYNSTANGQYSALIGTGSTASAQFASVMGANTTASGQYSTALGSTAQATNQYNTAVGYGALANNSNQATAIGSTAQATYQNTTAVGFNAQAINANQTTAIGANSQATVTSNTAVGFNAQATGNSNGTALGTNSNTTGQYATAIGSETDATTQYSTAIGYNAQAVTSTQSTAVGANTSAAGSNSTAIGYGAATNQNNALILGNNSANVGIGTSTPNTNTKLDVSGSFKLGTASTVLSNITKTSVNIVVPFLSVGTTVNVTAGVAGANPNATVIVNPRVNLPNGVVIAYTYVSSANTVTFGFGAGNYTGNVGTLTLDVTIIQ